MHADIASKSNNARSEYWRRVRLREEVGAVRVSGEAIASPVAFGGEYRTDPG